MMVPLSVPSVDDEEKALVLEVLASGWYAHGPYNHRFEERFAQFVGTRHAVTCNSGTSALMLALLAQDLRGEVIVPSFSFVATANAVVTAGCTPVFADVDPRTGNVDVDHAASLITPRTCALMPVHFAGQCCRIDALQRLAERHGLRLIEDCAETLGGAWNGRVAGSFGVGCFSFFPTKNITTGEGGMLTTDDDALAARLRALIGHGIDSTTFARERSERPWYRNARYAGYNFRMSNILAAMGYAQMKKLESMNAQRRAHAARLTAGLADLPWLETPFVEPEAEPVYQMYTVQVKDAAVRDRFVRHLNEREVKASVHFFPPIHEQEFYARHYPVPAGALPATERIARRIVTLPMYPDLQPDQIDSIIDAVRAFSA